MSEDVKPLPKPTSWDELYPSRFLKAGLMKGQDVTLTIASVFLERMPNDKGGEDVRGIISFEKTDKQLALNKVNGLCLKSMFGPAVQAWVGRRITLYPTQDKFGRETVDAIRVRGSPDIAAPVEFVLKMPKKAPKTVHLAVTGKKSDPAPATPPQP